MTLSQAHLLILLVEGLVCENRLLTSVGVSMETPPFTMTSFQSIRGQVVVWCKYSSSETDDRIAS